MKHFKSFFAIAFIWMMGLSSAFAATGDVFTVLTVENVEVTFSVIHEVGDDQPATARIGTVESNPAMSDNTVGVVTIPETVSREVNGTTYTYTVVSTGYNAFYGRNQITQVNLPATLTEINPSCFKGCTSLETVNLPNGSQLTTIHYSAFENCTSLTSINLPASVTLISYDAFKGCEALTSFTIPEGLTEIGNNAFSGCSSLTRVNIPYSVTTLGQNVFEGCEALTDLYFDITSYKTTVLSSYPLFASLPNQEIRIHVNNIIYLAFKHKLTSWYFYEGQATATDPCEHLFVDGLAKVGDKGLAIVEAVDKTTGEVKRTYAARVVYVSVDGERKAIIYGGDFNSTESLDENQCWDGYVSWGVHVGSAFEQISSTDYSNMRLTFPSHVEDCHGDIYTVIGLGAFATWGCSFYGIEEVRIPKTYTHLGNYALTTLSYLQNYVVIPSSVRQLGSPKKSSPSEIFAESSENTGDENRLKSVYFLHRDANVTWYESSTNQYFRWKNYDNRYVYLRVCQDIADTYCTDDASWNGFKAWTNYVMTGDTKTSHQKRSTWSPQYAAYIDGTPKKHYEPGDYSVIVYNDRFRLPITAEHFTSTDESVVEITGAGTATNGDVALYYRVKKVGEANIVFHYPGDDVFDELESSVTVISKSETACGDQTLYNQYNTVAAPSAGVAKINLTEDDFNIDETYEQAAMTTAGGKLYVSLTSNEYYSSGDGLMLKSSPDLLTPNYGAAYRTAYAANGSDGVSDMQQGADYGGMLCFKVPSGKGTIIIDGYLYDSSAILGVRVAGNAEMRLTNNNEWTYEYDVEADSWAYIYGINLGEESNYKAYIKSITIQPEGAPMPKVSILGQDIEDYANLDDLLGDGGSVKFNWGYPGETDVTAADAQAATLTLNNATLTNANGPAIEVNSLNALIVFVEGTNTVSGTGEASISMGTLNGVDWDGTMLYVVNEEGNASSLAIPNSAKYGIYSYDGAASIIGITSTNVAGSECGFYINNVNGTSGGYDPVSAPAKSPMKKMVSSYYIGQLAITGVQSAIFSGGQAAVYGLSVAPESNSESDCSIVEIDPEDAVFNSYLSSYVVIDESGDIKAPMKKLPSYPDVTYATRVVFGPQPPAITICGRGITKEDFLNSEDGTIAINAEGTAILSWEELENNGVDPKAPSKGKDDDYTLYDYGLPVLTLNGANLSYTGNGPAIEVNTYRGFFIRVKGTNSITATNASSVISVGTARGRNDNSSDYTPSLIILNDDELSGDVQPSLTITNSKEGGDGIYVYQGSCDVQNCAVNITAPQYALHYYYDSNVSPKAPLRAEKGRAPHKIVAPDGPIGYAGYLNIYDAGLSLRGGEAALWGAQGYQSNSTYVPGYFVNVGLLGTDMADYNVPEGDTAYGPEFYSATNNEPQCLGSYYYGAITNDGFDGPYICKYLNFGKDIFTVPTTQGESTVNMTFKITGDNTVQTYGYWTNEGHAETAIPSDFSGSLTIPATVTYQGVTYTVTAIGDESFDADGLPDLQLTNVTIPSTITYIGEYAFYGCSLTSVTIPNSVTTIDYYAFCDCSSLETLTLGRGIRSFGEGAFEDCPLITVYANMTTPPSLPVNSWTSNGETQYAYVFDVLQEGQTRTLYVPAGCADAYQDSDWWSQGGFSEIVEMEGGTQVGDFNGDDDVNQEDVTLLANYILSNSGIVDNSAADINGDGDVNIADVTALINIILGKNMSPTGNE